MHAWYQPIDAERSLLIFSVHQRCRGRFGGNHRNALHPSSYLMLAAPKDCINAGLDETTNCKTCVLHSSGFNQDTVVMKKWTLRCRNDKTKSSTHTSYVCMCYLFCAPTSWHHQLQKNCLFMESVNLALKTFHCVRNMANSS